MRDYKRYKLMKEQLKTTKRTLEEETSSKCIRKQIKFGESKNNLKTKLLLTKKITDQGENNIV